MSKIIGQIFNHGPQFMATRQGDKVILETLDAGESYGRDVLTFTQEQLEDMLLVCMYKDVEVTALLGGYSWAVWEPILDTGLTRRGTVSKSDDDYLHCDCEQNRLGYECIHIRLVQDFLKHNPEVTD